MGRRSPPDQDACLECLATVPAVLDYIDARLETGVIGGRELNAADFHAGMVVRGVMSITDLAPRVAGRAPERLAERTYREPIPAVAPFLSAEQLQVVG
jgi:hypothetical protein